MLEEDSDADSRQLFTLDSPIDGPDGAMMRGADKVKGRRLGYFLDPSLAQSKGSSKSEAPPVEWGSSSKTSSKVHVSSSKTSSKTIEWKSK